MMLALELVFEVHRMLFNCLKNTRVFFQRLVTRSNACCTFVGVDLMMLALELVFDVHRMLFNCLKNTRVFFQRLVTRSNACCTFVGVDS